MRDLLFLLGALGFSAFIIMLMMGIAGAGIQFWVELFF